MKWKDIEKIMKKHEKYAQMLEEYDKTGKLPLKKKRRFKAKRNTASRLTKSKQRTMNLPLIDSSIG